METLERQTVESDRYLTVAQVAEVLGLRADGVRWRLRTKQLPGVRIGKTKAGWRISERELAAWIAARHSGPSEVDR